MKKSDIRARFMFICSMAVLPAIAQDKAWTPNQEHAVHMGAHVMPFDLARTTHYFDDTATGGVETVTANDPGDHQQAGLIQMHLAHEAEQFAHGDFSDPAKIHGSGMPGLATLAAAGENKLRVTSKPLPAGASLTFSSTDAGVIAAIHQWFAAQRADHAAHGLHHQ